mgnify:CR=1 FL=1
MKKLILILMIAFTTTANAGWFSTESELDHRMAEIESMYDYCLETGDKAYCTNLMYENPMMEVMGNKKLYKQLLECTPGNKCYSTSYRIMMKTAEATLLVLE